MLQIKLFTQLVLQNGAKWTCIYTPICSFILCADQIGWFNAACDDVTRNFFSQFTREFLILLFLITRKLLCPFFWKSTTFLRAKKGCTQLDNEYCLDVYKKQCKKTAKILLTERESWQQVNCHKAHLGEFSREEMNSSFTIPNFYRWFSRGILYTSSLQ